MVALTGCRRLPLRGIDTQGGPASEQGCSLGELSPAHREIGDVMNVLADRALQAGPASALQNRSAARARWGAPGCFARATRSNVTREAPLDR